MFACLHSSNAVESDELTNLAGAFSPVIETFDPFTVIFSIEGLGRLMGSPQQIASEIARMGQSKGLNCNLAIAASPDTALHAARYFNGLTIVPRGEELNRLGELPLRELAMPPEMQEALEVLGVRTFADFAALPPLGIVERFGAEGLRLQDQARGSCRRPLHLNQVKHDFTLRKDLEQNLDNLQPLLFVVNSMLGDLCREMMKQGLAARELHLHLGLEHHNTDDRTLAFPMPLRDSAAMLKLLQRQMDANPPAASIATVTLTLIPSSPRGTQRGMFQASSPEPASLAITLARLESIVGEGNVWSAELKDTHRPDAFRIRQFAADPGKPESSARERTSRLALRIFRPALHAQVVVEHGYPQRVTAKGISGNITKSAGPWRSSGDWWTQNDWARDEWDVSLSDGGLYRLFRSGGWYVAGVYD